MTLLLVLACQTDPLLDPVFVPVSSTTDEVYALEPKGEWRVGAVMEAELFVASTRGAQLQGSLGTGRGRPNEDLWTVRPDLSVADPSAYWEDMPVYIANRRTGVRGGQEARIPLVVSDEVGFKTPGVYALQLQTRRIDGERVILPAFKVEVKPRDREVDQRVFDEAMAGLKTAKRKEADAHYRSLRALGTSATLQAAVSAIQKPGASPWWSAILHTHPDRAGVREALEEVLQAPDQIVTWEVLQTLTAVDYNERFAAALGEQPPPNQVPALKAFNAERERRRVELQRIQIEVAERLVSAFEKKTVGKGISLAALSKVAFNATDVPWREDWLKMLRENLDILPESALQDVFSERWSKVKDPTAVPALERLARSPTPYGDLALGRLSTLDPEAAKAVAVARLHTPPITASQLGERVIAGLSNLPAAEKDALVDALGQAPASPWLARLVAVHGEARHREQVVAAYRKLPPTTPTEIRGAYGAFFMNTRTEPGLVKEILALEGTTHPRILQEIARSHARPTELVPMAMAGILAEDGAVNVSAAEVIAEHADPSVRPALNRALFEAPPSRQIALATALFSARNWLIRKADRDRLDPLFVDGRASRLMMSMVIVTDEMSRLLARVDDGVPILTVNGRDYVGEEAILRKLSQFYKGAPVKFVYASGSTDETKQSIEALAQKAGLAVFVPNTSKAKKPQK